MRLPVNDAVLTSEYGWRANPLGPGAQFHDGRDYANVINGVPHANQSVFTMWPGKVAFDMDNYNDALRWTDDRHSLGNVIIMLHNVKGVDFFVRYCHLVKNYVSLNDSLPEGYLIGAYGDVGQSKGPHIHVDAYMASNWQKVNIKELMEG